MISFYQLHWLHHQWPTTTTTTTTTTEVNTMEPLLLQWDDHSGWSDLRWHCYRPTFM